MEIKNYYVVAGLPQTKSPIKILFEVCKDYDINVRQLRMKTRAKERVQARYIACYFLKNLTTLTLAQIAQVVGLGDHASVLHGLKKIEYQIEKYDDVRERYERIKKQL